MNALQLMNSVKQFVRHNLGKEIMFTGNKFEVSTGMIVGYRKSRFHYYDNIVVSTTDARYGWRDMSDVTMLVHSPLNVRHLFVNICLVIGTWRSEVNNNILLCMPLEITTTISRYSVKENNLELKLYSSIYNIDKQLLMNGVKEEDVKSEMDYHGIKYDGYENSVLELFIIASKEILKKYGLWKEKNI